MTPEDYLRSVASRLSDAGAQVHTENVAGDEALVGYRADFRLKWFATKLHLFTVVRSVPTASAEALDRYSNDVLSFAVQRKGRFRGLQNGVAAIPVMVTLRAEPDATQWARERLVRRWSAFAWPVVVDLSTSQIGRHEGPVRIGGVYAGWMREQIALALPHQGD